VGDIILFSKRPKFKEKIKVKVISRKDCLKSSLLPRYYSKKEKNKYGVVIFGIELINKFRIINF
jgi:hypothetical protein